MKNGSLVSLFACIAFVVSACNSAPERGSFSEVKSFGEVDAIVTSADARLVISVPVGAGTKHGRVVPSRIVCAEPSPDFAKAVQTAFGFGAALGVDIPAQGQGNAAISIANTRAVSAAQLGERLATIQLLRDGLYRACEAYANGAFSEVTYAVLLSRYDDTMISMLMGEFAAGNFGRQLAVLSGSTTGTASADSKIDAAFAMAKDATDAAEKSDQELEKSAANLDEKENALDAANEQDPSANHSAEEQALADAQRDFDEKKARSILDQNTKANVTATAAAVAAGAINRTPTPAIAQTLHEIQRRYIENVNSDALVVACPVAMSRDKANDKSALSEFCGGNNGAMVKVLTAQGDILKAIKDRYSLDASVSNIEAARQTLGNFAPEKGPMSPVEASQTENASPAATEPSSSD